MEKYGARLKVAHNELDKTPRSNPYHFALHTYLSYVVYGVLLWQSFNCLRAPQESSMTLKNIADHNIFRSRFFKYVHAIVPIILITGFFTAATEARVAINTFPHIN